MRIVFPNIRRPECRFKKWLIREVRCCYLFARLLKVVIPGMLDRRKLCNFSGDNTWNFYSSSCPLIHAFHPKIKTNRAHTGGYRLDIKIKIPFSKEFQFGECIFKKPFGNLIGLGGIGLRTLVERRNLRKTKTHRKILCHTLNVDRMTFYGNNSVNWIFAQHEEFIKTGFRNECPRRHTG